MMRIEVRRAACADADWMQESSEEMGWRKPDGYFARCCRQQEKGELVLFVAAAEEVYLGHLKVVWEPDYSYFKANGIPEIQDLNVLPRYRRKGIATRLMDKAEALIRTRSEIAGIGFGMYTDYGPAQRMYVRRGYVPDGNGMMYRNQSVRGGDVVVADDDLVLYLTKTLD